MTKEQERILVVESDPMVSDLIARQTLTPQGYKVKVVKDAGSAIKQAITFSPHVVIANLELLDLSGKDLIVALNAQNISIPLIMIAPQGNEKDVIQAFRLGASDYISAPVREAEVVSAVERALTQERARSERRSLQRQVEVANQELQKRVNELTTIFGIGKAVTSETDPDKLFSTLVEGGLRISEADFGWLLVKDDHSPAYILSAHKNLPKSLSANLNKPWDDGVSSLVALSGETFSIHGTALKRFKISGLGKSAIVTPVKIQNQTIAMLVFIRKADKEFDKSDQAMLEAVSDYASISLVNARLFRALDQRAASLQKSFEKTKESEHLLAEIIRNVSHELHNPLTSAKGYVDLFVEGHMGKQKRDQREALEKAQNRLARALGIVDVMELLYETSAPREVTHVNLNDLTSQALGRFQKSAKESKIKFKSDLPRKSIFINGDPSQLNLVFDALLSNAIKFSPNGGRVVVEINLNDEDLAEVSVKDYGIGIAKKDHELIFERFSQVDGTIINDETGLGIGLTLVQEIIKSHGGDVWLESKPDVGSTFFFTLPAVQ